MRGSLIKTFVCQCYSFDVAEYIEVTEKLGEINAVVIYRLKLVRIFINCKTLLYEKTRVGIYSITGFMAAININHYWDYLTEFEIEQFKEKGWILAIQLMKVFGFGSYF